jgi:ribose-phosphate pyrophosphokinase
MIYEVKKFKDSQVTAKIVEKGDLHVKIRGNTYEDLFKAAAIKEAWDFDNAQDKGRLSKLTIFCLIGQRSDRRFDKGGSFDLKIVCDFINSMGFDKVLVLHPHSDVSIALINNSEKIPHLGFVQKAFNQIGNPILISPDAGAYKITHSIAEAIGSDMVPSNKVRVGGTPKVSIQGDVSGKKCLIVDDLADGGRTFKNLAEELRRQGATSVFLYVTHGQFNYGFGELKESIDRIYCTNSYRDINNLFVEQFKIDL